MSFSAQKILKLSNIIRKCLFSFSQTLKINEHDTGTDYNNWVLMRAAGHNHSVAHLKRKFPKDRYSIHRLTNLQFMCDLVKFEHKYSLNMNEKIVLLAQFNHIIEVMGKNKKIYEFYLFQLTSSVYEQMKNPSDLVCMGTFISCLITMGRFDEDAWIPLVDDILAHKFDEDYDELFGIIIGLNKYRNHLKQKENYLQISKDKVAPQIPIIYRNSLEVLRQYITQNVYNLKQCRLLFEALYQAKINQGYFWNSVRDWFNIYTKEQLGKKHFDQYFIMKESAVQKILHDHGIIRPRPILQQLSSIVYILSQFGNISWRFVEFAQDLILYAIDNGSKLFKNYQEIAAEEQKYFMKQQPQINLNEHIQTQKQQQRQNIKKMQKKYKTIFVNPISLKNNFIVNLLVVLSRAYKQYRQPQIASEQGSHGSYDKKNQVYLDPRVKKWLLLQLIKPQMQYTVKQLLMIHKCSDFLKDSQITLEEFIAQKLGNLRHTNSNFAQIKQLMKILPLVKYDKLNILLADFLKRNHPSEILLMTKYLQKQKLWAYIAEYLLNLPRSVNSHEKYYSFEENCYFMLMLLQNQDAINAVHGKDILKREYESEMEQLKEYIKTITYGRGFKMAVNSYFHQIMDYIDVVQFFQGGRF